jgi:hypothetical protein
MCKDSNFSQFDPASEDDSSASAGPWANAWQPVWDAKSTGHQSSTQNNMSANGHTSFGESDNHAGTDMADRKMG